MVGSKVSASKTITSSYDGPRYLSSSANADTSKVVIMRVSASLFIIFVFVILYVLKITL